MKKQASGINGFTLVELLIGLGVIMIMFYIIVSITTGTTKSSSFLNAKNELTQDAQIAERIIAGRLSEAIYVYNTGTLQLTANGITTENNTGSSSTQNWNVNSDPFVAMILPPENPTFAAGSNVPTNCTATLTAGCYRFYAYYAVRREALVEAAAAGSLAASSAPVADRDNPNAWTIMQYQQNLRNWVPSYATPREGMNNTNLPMPVDYQRGVGRILLDYVEPQVQNDTANNDLFTTAGGAAPSANAQCQLFCVSVPFSQQNNGQVDVRFRVKQEVEGQSDIEVRGVTTGNINRPYLGGVVSPRNWWGP